MFGLEMVSKWIAFLKRGHHLDGSQFSQEHTTPLRSRAYFSRDVMRQAWFQPGRRTGKQRTTIFRKYLSNKARQMFIPRLSPTEGTNIKRAISSRKLCSAQLRSDPRNASFACFRVTTHEPRQVDSCRGGRAKLDYVRPPPLPLQECWPECFRNHRQI